MSYDIREWDGFDHFKYIMDHIYVGCKIIVSDDFNNDFGYDKDSTEYTVTDIRACSCQEEEHVDVMCQICVGEIGLDGNRPDCLHCDSIMERKIDTYISKIIEFEEIEFIEIDEMKI